MSDFKDKATELTTIHDRIAFHRASIAATKAEIEMASTEYAKLSAERALAGEEIPNKPKDIAKKIDYLTTLEAVLPEMVKQFDTLAAELKAAGTQYFETKRRALLLDLKEQKATAVAGIVAALSDYAVVVGQKRALGLLNKDAVRDASDIHEAFLEVTGATTTTLKTGADNVLHRVDSRLEALSITSGLGIVGELQRLSELLDGDNN